MEESRTQQLQQLLKRLGDALHGSVVNSDEVQSCLQDLHAQGWDAVMMLEASVVCHEDGEVKIDQGSLHIHADPPERRLTYRLNLQDASLLTSLGISPTRHRSGRSSSSAAPFDDSTDR